MRIVGLTGPKYVGKTTVARVLGERPYYLARRSFAEPPREMIRTLLRLAGLSEAEIAAATTGSMKETPLSCLRGRSYRHAIRTLGDEWGRQLVDEGLWTGILERRVTSEGVDVVVDDVRYEDEAELIRRLGGRVVELHRDGVERRVDPASEAGVRADLLISNNRHPEIVAREIAEACWPGWRGAAGERGTGR